MDLKLELQEIMEKCAQYWNESCAFTPEEVHAILEFIHSRAERVLDKLRDLDSEKGL